MEVHAVKRVCLSLALIVRGVVVRECVCGVLVRTCVYLCVLVCTCVCVLLCVLVYVSHCEHLCRRSYVHTVRAKNPP